MTRRRVLLLAVAGVLAAAATALAPTAVAAMNPVRTSVVAYEEARLGERLPGPHPDVTLALDAWAAAAVDLTPVRDDIARSAPTELGDHAALHLVEDTCASVLDVPSEQPRPGDLVAYRTDAAVDAPWRLGVFLTTVEVAVVSEAEARLVVVQRDVLLSGAASPLLRARPESVKVCRFRASLMPGGTDDGASGPGRVMLVAPDAADARLAWAFAHPRDAVGAPGHVLGALLRPVGALFADVAPVAVGLLLAAAHGLGHLPVVGAALAVVGGAAARVLGTTFDGERLHRILTGAGVAALVVAAVVAGGPLLLAGAAVATAALAARGRVPVLGAVGDGLWSVASFVVSTFTGVDDSRRVRLGGVLLALAADLVVGAQPLATALRAAGAGTRVSTVFAAVGTSGRVGAMVRPATALLRPLGSGLRTVLRGAADLSDIAALRPRAWLGAVSTAHRGAWLADVAAGDPASIGVAGGITARLTDLVALRWRPQSSLVSDLTTHLHDGGEALAEALRSGSPQLQAFAARLLRTDPESAARVLRTALPHVERTATALKHVDELSHLHAGGRTVVGLATNQGPTPAVGTGPVHHVAPGPTCSPQT